MSESLLFELTRSLAEIPENQIIVDLVKDMNVEELRQLSTDWLLRTMPIFVPPQTLLRVFLYQVQSNSVPSKVVPPVADNQDPSEKAFIAFTVLSKGWIELLKVQSHLAEAVIETLPGMVQWGIYLFNQRIDTPLKDANDICTFVIHTFNQLLSVPQVKAVMVKDTPGIYEMTARYWMKAPPEILDYTASFFQSLCFEITWEQLNEVGRAAKVADRPVEIAEIALSRAKSYLAKGKIRSLALATNVLLLLMRVPGHYFVDLLLEKKVTTTFTSTLVKTTKLLNAYRGPKNTDEWHRLENSVSISIVSVRFVLIRNTGFPYIRESLKAGLLQALCDLAKHFDDLPAFPRDCIRIILADSLTRSLVIGSVVKISYEVLKSIENQGQDEAMKKSYLAKEWSTFKSLIGIREDLLENSPKEKDAPKTCASDKCTAPPRMMKELKLCSGCRVTSYCSEDCQRKDWKEGHRGYCKLKQQEIEERERENRRTIFHPSDVQFLRSLSLSDMAIHLPHLEALARQTCPSVPRNQLVLCLDYTKADIPTGTCYLKNLSTYEFDGGDDKGGWADPGALELRARQNAELLKIVRNSPSSYTFLEISFILGEFVIRRNFVSNANMLECAIGVGFWPELEDATDIKKSSACPNFVDLDDLNRAAISKLIGDKVQGWFK